MPVLPAWNRTCQGSTGKPTSVQCCGPAEADMPTRAQRSHYPLYLPPRPKKQSCRRICCRSAGVPWLLCAQSKAGSLRRLVTPGHPLLRHGKPWHRLGQTESAKTCIGSVRIVSPFECRAATHRSICADTRSKGSVALAVPHLHDVLYREQRRANFQGQHYKLFPSDVHWVLRHLPSTTLSQLSTK